jgi:superfamily I DNA and/or RNA helicase
MDKLITFRFKGRDVFCETESIRFLIKDRRSHLPIYQGKIHNIEEVKAFLSETTKDRRSYYFLETESGSYLPVEFTETAETFSIYGEYSESKGEIIRIFQKNYPYPEIQQKHALNVFREGRLENSHLKTYLMDAKNVDSKPSGFLPQKFFNPYIEKNDYQKDTVQRALKEEEFFMIQGPPGTGKTTVIIEIIRQYISQYPHHRILVVSQANVAVDNVMKDLIDYYNPNELIRCGKEDRMEDHVKPISFEYKYEQYINDINNIKETSINSPFLKKWKGIVETKGGQYNSDVGELILRSHNIVGATCVGLAQKNIGLDRLHFDLVIIDEA